jgi:TRAP-type C4-dicarboxylate transport system permease small subunit
VALPGAPERAGGGSKTLRILAAGENAFLVLLLGLLVIFAFAQIILRYLNVSIAWSEPLTRILVLWVGVLGAVVASRANEHISIDALSRFLPERPRVALAALVGFFTSAVCAVLAYQAVRFVQFEYEGGTAKVGVVPGWVLALVLPIGFALIATRYALFAARQVRACAQRRHET